MRFFSKAQRATSVAALALALALAGCSAQSTSSTPAASASSTSPATSVVTGGTPAELAGSIAEATHFDADDLTWDKAKETTITMADGGSTADGENSGAVVVAGSTVTITAGGTYRLSGQLSDGALVVAAGDEDVVRIVLDNASVSSSTGSAVDIQSANEVLLYLEAGTTNTLSDTASYANTATDAPNAAVYSLADLTIAGAGKLSVNGNYQDGIVSKDGLVLASGNVTVKAADDGIKGKDYTVLLAGSYAVTAGGDGIKSTNDTDADSGWLLMAGGTLQLAAGDDGIKAATTLTISGGTATVSKSEEGLEAAHIAISGGTVNVTSNDDGVNAAGGSTTSTDAGGGAVQGAPQGGMGGGGMDTVGDFSVDISGGSLTINSQGDGLDSNGNATISGGTVVVNGPVNDGNGALDVNGELSVTGGTIAAAGSSGMAVTPGTSSTQSGVQLTFDSPLAAGTAVHLTDSTGAVVATFVTTKQTSSLVFSSAAIKTGEQYTGYTGGTADVKAGLGTGSITGATRLAAVTAGEYTAARGPGRR